MSRDYISCIVDVRPEMKLTVRTMAALLVMVVMVGVCSVLARAISSNGPNV